MASSRENSAHPSSALRKALIAVGIGAAILAIAVAIQSLPIFYLKPLGAQTYANQRVIVYYERGDEAGARQVFDLMSSQIDDIDARMQYQPASAREVYVYKAQSSLWLRKYGLVTLLFAPSWYIGDNRGNIVLLVSPNTPVRGHTPDSILGAALHELIHTINYEKNPKLSYFWDNGLATYITGQTPPPEFLSFSSLPTLEQTHTENEMEFGNMGGYAYSYSYIEYLDKTYGWDKVIAFASGGKTYQEVFGVSEQQIYAAWADYLRQ